MQSINSMKSQVDLMLRVSSTAREGTVGARQGLGPLSVGLALLILTLAPMARAQLALPVSVPSATLSTTGTVLVYTVDLDTLPARPKLVIDIDPGPTHSDIQLEVEVTNFTPPPGVSGFSSCPLNGGTGWTSPPSDGALHFEADLYECYPGLTFWNGIDADVRIRALDFGSGGAPASVSVEIEGITQVPTGTLLQQVMGPQVVSATAVKDTVFYEDDPGASNGAGESLWAGDSFFIGLPVPSRFARRSLIGFNSLSTTLPPNAVVTHAALDLFAMSVAGGGGGVELFAVATSPLGNFWAEGSADAPGDEFFGVSGGSFPANYLNRTSTEAWMTPGGDTTSATPMDVRAVSAPGPVQFDAVELVPAVQKMVDDENFSDGFLLEGPAGLTTTRAVRFASSEHPNPDLRPVLTVGFSQSEPFGEGRVAPGTVDFIDEGDDFRWVYDLDDDGIFVTDIDGICEETATFPVFTYPYTYSYAGDPDFVGVDCCTWRIDSIESATVGTGQALFFHNLDPADPSNMPPDFDGDGILDTCDNCIYTPNGPALGSCMNGATLAGACLSDLECGPGEVCDLSQLDTDGNSVGNACPEPGFASGLMLGMGSLAALLRRRPGRAPRLGGGRDRR